MTDKCSKLTLNAEGKLLIDDVELKGPCHVVILRMVKGHQFYAAPTEGSLQFDEFFIDDDDFDESGRKLIWSSRLVMLQEECLKSVKSVGKADYLLFDMPLNSEDNYALFDVAAFMSVAMFPYFAVVAIEPEFMPNGIGVFYRPLRGIRSKAIKDAIRDRQTDSLKFERLGET